MHKRIPNLIQPFLSNGTVLPQLPLSNGWLAPSKLLTNEVPCLNPSARRSVCLKLTPLTARRLTAAATGSDPGHSWSGKRGPARSVCRMNGRREREKERGLPIAPRQGQAGMLAQSWPFSLVFSLFPSFISRLRPSRPRAARVRWSSALPLSLPYLSLFLSHLAADAKFFKETKPAQAS